MDTFNNLSYKDVIKLFGNINLNVSKMDEFWDQFVRKRTGTKLCENMKVGLLEITISIETSSYDIDDTDEFFVYDSGLPVNEAGVAQHSYPTLNNGKGHVSAYPLEGMNFDDDDMAVLLSFGNIVYLMMERVRLGINIEKGKYMDLMTGLYNTPGIRTEGQKLAAVGELHHMAVLFINIRNFSGINDRIGMKNGNIVMIRYAKLLNTLSNMDRGLAARLGGDKFLLIIPKTQVDAAIAILKNIEFEIQILDHSETINVRAWIGIFEVSEIDSIDDAIGNASKTCEQARRRGLEDPLVYNKDN